MARRTQIKGASRILTLLAIALFLGFAISSAEAISARSAPFQALLSADGGGRLFVENGSQPSWMSCAPDLSSCSQFAVGGDVTTTGASPGTVFVAEGNWISPIWQGNVTSLEQPAVAGPVRANEIVTPIPGRWRGGWETDYDAMQLSACTKPESGHCTTLTDSRYPAGCKGDAAVLDAVFTGQYLRVADRRIAADTTIALGSDASPYGHEVWSADSTTAVATVGRIAPAFRHRTAKCGPPPLVKASISKNGTASVKCGLGCDAVLVATHRGRKALLARRLQPFPLAAPGNYPIPKLKLSRQSLARLGSGRIQMVVKVNGKLAAKRTVNLG